MKFFLYKHLKVRAKQLNKEIPSNWVQILKGLNNIQQLGDIKIKFSVIKEGFNNILNGTSIFKNHIILSLEWGAIYVLFNDDYEVNNALLISIGHELSHKINDVPEWKYKKYDKSFVSWINEVHADFSGANVMNLNRDSLVKSCKFKSQYKISQGNKDKDYSSHPSYAKRMSYAENYDFNEKLIKQIACDTNCRNENLVKEVSKHFKHIHLD